MVPRLRGWNIGRQVPLYDVEMGGASEHWQAGPILWYFGGGGGSGDGGCSGDDGGVLRAFGRLAIPAP
jgi:hypothetical protein